MTNVARDDRYLYVDGIRVARIVQRPDGPCLEFRDSDRRRSARRGSDRVEVKLDDLARVVKGDEGDGVSI